MHIDELTLNVNEAFINTLSNLLYLTNNLTITICLNNMHECTFK